MDLPCECFVCTQPSPGPLTRANELDVPSARQPVDDLIAELVPADPVLISPLVPGGSERCYLKRATPSGPGTAHRRNW